MIDETLALTVWNRLLSGQSLHGLPLGRHDGRWDLRGLRAPDPVALKTYETERSSVTVLGLKSVARNIAWRDLDFSGARINGLRLFHADLANCVFDDCQLQDLRIWATQVRGGSFRRADLRKAVLGGVSHGQLNAFEGVNFSGADLRQTIYKAARFVDCDFSGVRIEKINFNVTRFVRCRFAGELRSVQFYHHDLRGEPFPVNDMEDVDLRAADLRLVEFRHLDLERVMLPENEQHLIVRNYVDTLDRLIAIMRIRGDEPSACIAAILEMKRKWAAPGQKRGVLSLKDLVELGDQGAADAVRSAVAGH